MSIFSSPQKQEVEHFIMEEPLENETSCCLLRNALSQSGYVLARSLAVP